MFTASDSSEDLSWWILELTQQSARMVYEHGLAHEFVHFIERLVADFVKRAVEEAVEPAVDAAIKREAGLLFQRQKLWSVDDVALYLGVSRRTVETLIADGQLRPLWVGGSRRFTKEAIRAYLDTCTTRKR